MSRPLRIAFPDALYHVVSRGHRGEPVYDDDDDREMFLEILAEAVQRFNWRCYAYCLMTNHYHLLVETPDANLSAGMRHVNGIYTQASNRRHKRVGHVFQGRYRAILVDPEAYLLEVARYIVLNPVRTGMTRTPSAWPWSSYRATCGDEPAPDWLAVDRLLGRFSGGSREARKRYCLHVLNGVSVKDLWRKVHQQLYLGSQEFISRARSYAENVDDPNIPQLQRRAPVASLDDIRRQAHTRDEAIQRAYGTGAYSYSEIARYFGMHPSSVSRIVRGDAGNRGGFRRQDSGSPDAHDRVDNRPTGPNSPRCQAAS